MIAEDGFGAVIAVQAGHSQAVVTNPVLRPSQSQAVHIVAAEPFEGEARLVAMLRVACRAPGRKACVHRRYRLDRLLVKMRVIGAIGIVLFDHPETTLQPLIAKFAQLQRELDDARRAELRVQFSRIAAMAGPLLAFPLDERVEIAGVYKA